MAFFNEAGSHRSPTAASARSSTMLSLRLDGRTSNRSSAPCAASTRATWLPTNPVAPVMKAFMDGCYQFLKKQLNDSISTLPGLLHQAALQLRQKKCFRHQADQQSGGNHSHSETCLMQ